MAWPLSAGCKCALHHTGNKLFGFRILFWWRVCVFVCVKGIEAHCTLPKDA